MNKGKFYNIKSDYHFFSSLSCWLENKIINNSRDTFVILPNKRSCEYFSKMIFENENYDFKKRIICKAISDIDLNDIKVLFGIDKHFEIQEQNFHCNKISDFQHLFFIAQEVYESNIFGKINLSKSLTIAEALKNLFDDVERHGVDIEQMHNIDDTNLSLHRQFGVEFLKIFYHQIKNKIIRSNLCSEVEYRNFILKLLIELLENNQAEYDIVIAGSTGSIQYSKKLIKALSKKNNCYVVLYGMNGNFGNIKNESCPQFLFNRLIEDCDIEKSNILDIEYDDFKISSRSDFIAQVMMPSAETYKWNKFTVDKNIIEDISNNFKYYLCANQIEEVRLIVDLVKSFVNPVEKTAIIVHNQDFAELLRCELASSSLIFNDYLGKNFNENKVTNFLLLILSSIKNNFDSSSLLSIVKHQYLQKYFSKKEIESFETKVLRVYRKYSNLDIFIDEFSHEDTGVEDFSRKFKMLFSPILNISKRNSLSSYCEELLFFIKQFILINDGEDCLEGCADDYKDFIDIFKNFNNKNFLVHREELYDFFVKIFGVVKIFNENNCNSNLSIIPPIESRLLNFDNIIISNLNSGIFPRTPSSDWLGRKVRSDLSVDLSQQIAGQIAYDFCNFLSNKKIFFTASKIIASKIAIESPFILRLKTLCKKFQIEINCEYLRTRNIKGSILDIQFPKIKIEDRLKEIFVTDISNLLANPYIIYAKNILKLKEINPLDPKLGNREFGIFVHKALELYISNLSSKEIVDFDAYKHFKTLFDKSEDDLLWWPKFLKIFADFKNLNQKYINQKSFTEIKSSMEIEGIRLVGKIDRVIKNSDDFFEIIDYKTGNISSKNDVINFIDPQLVLCALIFSKGKIDNNLLKLYNNRGVSSISYWNLAIQGQDIVDIANGEYLFDLVEKIHDLLRLVFLHYQKEDNFYNPIKDCSVYNQYWHLQRDFEKQFD